MNKKIILSVLLCAICILFCGCAKMANLTEDEKSDIAAYSAKIVAKYNKNQKDGISNLKSKAEEADTSKTTEGNATTTDTNQPNASTGNEQQKQAVTLANALGISGVTFTYEGFEVKDQYQTSTYFMSPTAGKNYLIFKFNMTNVSGGELPVDILSKTPKFTATVNGKSKANNELSLMAEDLATFKGTLQPNESKELVIIFMMNKDELADVQNVELSTNINGSTVNIAL